MPDDKQRLLAQLVGSNELQVVLCCQTPIGSVPSGIGEDLPEAIMIKTSSLSELLPPIFDIGWLRINLHKGGGG